MASALAPDVAVIGGSGFYDFLEDAEPVALDTPYGPPSEPPRVGEVDGRAVAFLPRHGRDHRFPPHRVPYRANLWALRALGVRQVLAPYAVGSLRPDLPPGALVVPDQLVDRTSGRAQTFHDGPAAVHVGFADPYCPVGRTAAVRAASDAAWSAHDGGTMVVIEGPRFSTRAESRWFTAQGWSLVNMTGHPEAVLARELAMCCTALALVTDYDAGVTPEEAVTQEEVFRVFAEHTERLRAVVRRALALLPAAADRSCGCRRALAGTDVDPDA